MNLIFTSPTISKVKLRGVILRQSTGIPTVFSSNYVFSQGENITQGQIQILPNVQVEVPPGAVWNLQP